MCSVLSALLEKLKLRSTARHTGAWPLDLWPGLPLLVPHAVCRYFLIPPDRPRCCTYQDRGQSLPMWAWLFDHGSHVDSWRSPPVVDRQREAQTGHERAPKEIGLLFDLGLSFCHSPRVIGLGSLKYSTHAAEFSYPDHLTLALD